MTTSISRVVVKRTPPPTLTLNFHPKATMPKRLEDRACELGISAEQLVHRFISDGMRKVIDRATPCELGTSMQDVLERNGALAA